MSNRPFSIVAVTIFLCSFICHWAGADQVPEFNEATIRDIQGTRSPSPAFSNAIQTFEMSNDPAVKAAKWEDAVIAESEGLLTATWATPVGGWRLLDFSAVGNLTLRDIADQGSQKASYTKLVAKNETDAVRLRGAGSLMLSASLEGEQWGEKLLLSIAQRPNDNLKRITYWFTKNFAQDWHAQGETTTGATTWRVNWNGWQQVYAAANSLGKAIVLKNITVLAVRRNEVAVAGAINLSALSGTDRELKAIALAFGDPALGSAVMAKWAEIAKDSSDPQLQALAKEVRVKFAITD